MKKLSLLSLSVMAAISLCACSSANNSVIEVANSEYIIEKAQVKQGFIKGADISTLLEMEKSGFKYFNRNNEQKDALTILQEEGFNYIRVRVWVDPKDDNGISYGGGSNDLATLITLSKRAQTLGMGILVDFHYSDFWTDPGKQFKPKAWEKLSFDDLVTQLYTYTKSVMQELKNNGIEPQMVQVGNEINSGILWPDGKSWGGDGFEFDRLAKLLESGSKAVKEISPNSEVMLHLAQGTKSETFKWWFDEIVKRNVNFDSIGMSMYTWWDGPIQDLTANIDYVYDRYQKPVYVVETSYPYTLENEDNAENTFTLDDQKKTGYEASVIGQAKYLKDLLESVSNTKGGMGVFYWEPAWKTGKNITWASPQGMDYINDHWKTGNSREDQALFDKQGHVLQSITIFNN